VVLLSIFHFLPSTFEIYPCLCLCLGFSQITRITPFRFTILHLSQIFLTDALTFTASTSITQKLCPEPHMVQGLFLPKNNSPPREIIGGEFHCHLISWEDFDEVHSHLSRNMGQHLVAVFQLYSEHRIGKGFQNLPFHLDRILLWHNLSIHALKRAWRLIDGRFDQKFDRVRPFLELSEELFCSDNTG